MVPLRLALVVFLVLPVHPRAPLSRRWTDQCRYCSLSTLSLPVTFYCFSVLLHASATNGDLSNSIDNSVWMYCQLYPVPTLCGFDNLRS